MDKNIGDLQRYELPDLGKFPQWPLPSEYHPPSWSNSSNEPEKNKPVFQLIKYYMLFDLNWY